MNRNLSLRIGAIAVVAVGQNSLAQSITTERIMNAGLLRPIFVTHAPGDSTRLYIIEKAGKIAVYKDGSVQATRFLDIDAIVGGGNSESSEQGLLGLAFHPDFPNTPYFYVNYTDLSGDTRIVRYTATTADIADAGSAQQVMFYDQPQSNHNGGWLGFGPLDGLLYIAAGDGGGSNDQGGGHTEPGGNGQDITDKLLGKMLRVNIDADDFPADGSKNYAIPPNNPFVGITGDDEIWAFGLRNPWRPSFDRETGDLYIADVGQNVWEEINFQPASSAGGENYGWRCREGAHDFDADDSVCIANAGTFVEPIHEYSHGSGCSITGGYVYRGCKVAGLAGTYFFADYCSATIWSFRVVDGQVTEFTNRTAELDPPDATIGAITSFGEDADGELYICDQAGGEIFRIIPAGGVQDCNANGIADGCDIASGFSEDCDGNNVPDECDPDCNENGVADGCDIAGGTSGDCDANGVPDECDIAAGDQEDCDGSGVPDECELADGTLSDCDSNDIADECDPGFCAADLAPPLDTLNVFDFLVYQTYFGEGNPCADITPPFGVLNVFDFLEFQTLFGNGC